MLGAAVLVRAWMFGYPYMIDETDWAYGGREWFLRGVSPYQAIFESKPPGIYALNGILWWLGLSHVNWARLVTALAVGLTGVFLLRMGERLGSLTAGVVAGLGYVLWASARSAGEAQANVEPWTMLFSVAAMRAALSAARTRDYLVAGACTGGALLFRQTALFDATVVAFTVATCRPPVSGAGASGPAVARAPARLLLMLVGCLLVLAPVVVYFAAIGDLTGLVEVGYLAMVKGSSGYGAFSRWPCQRNWLPFMRDGALLLVGTVTAMAAGLPRNPITVRHAVQAWALVSVASEFVTGPRWNHHLITCMPPLCLLGGLGLEHLASSWRLRPRPQRVAATIMAVLLLCGYLYGQLPSARRAAAYITRGPFVNKGRIVAELIARNTGPEETILAVADNFAQGVYLYADRRAPSRQINVHYEDYPTWFAEMSEGLRLRPPAYVVFGNHDLPALPDDRLTPGERFLAEYVRRGPFRRFELPGVPGMYIYERIRPPHTSAGRALEIPVEAPVNTREALP